MAFRSIVILLIVAAIAVLAALNWSTLATPSAISLGFTSFQAPLGLLMLGLTVLLGVFFIAYVLSLQGSVLLETRRHAKEMQAQRELADRAEASRFTELRAFLESQHQQGQAALLARIDVLESHVAARVQESDNATAAYVGQLEDQLRTRRDPVL
ncbi:Signal transduction histidine kinase [Paracidovorax avenae]|uniref:Signal transduction histidine kinase n=1 Tax=Paracidovorax avenae TaxID=80867 RepID=UPI000D169053|nr:Signal transduction histidine kinase [Paracidovorax avenae]AVS70140.1 Signal transduction histidine kinase [Paracidovorax avenae]